MAQWRTFWGPQPIEPIQHIWPQQAAQGLALDNINLVRLQRGVEKQITIGKTGIYMYQPLGDTCHRKNKRKHGFVHKSWCSQILGGFVLHMTESLDAYHRYPPSQQSLGWPDQPALFVWFVCWWLVWLLGLLDWLGSTISFGLNLFSSFRVWQSGFTSYWLPVVHNSWISGSSSYRYVLQRIRSW